MEKAAAILCARGEHTDAIRILAEEVAPFYENSNDARALARVRADLARAHLARAGAGDRETAGALLVGAEGGATGAVQGIAGCH